MPELTDEQRLQMYRKCTEERHKFNPAALISFIEGLFTADLAAIAAPFIEGFKKDGCDVFLTDAQKRERDRIQYESELDQGLHRGPNRPPV